MYFEKIINQGPNERGYHIFFFFIAGMPVEELEKYYLSENGKKISFDSINYLKKPSGIYLVDKIDDVKEFQTIYDSLGVLGFR